LPSFSRRAPRPLTGVFRPGTGSRERSLRSARTRFSLIWGERARGLPTPSNSRTRTQPDHPGRGRGGTPGGFAPGRDSPEQSDQSPRGRAVEILRDAFKNQIPVEGRVAAVNKGGFEVEISGLRAFCPISQMELRYCENPMSMWAPGTSSESWRSRREGRIS